MARELAVECVGLLGGEVVRLGGGARWKRPEGRLALQLGADRVPLLIDPALVLLAALDLVVAAELASARQGAPLELPEDGASARVGTALLEEGLRQVGSFDLAGRVTPDGGGTRIDLEILRAELVAEPAERVASVEGAHAVLVGAVGYGLVTVLGSLALSTTHGRELRLVTTTLLEPAERRHQALAVWYEEPEFRREGDLLLFDSNVRPLALRD